MTTAAIHPLSSLQAREALAAADRADMFALLDQHFEGVTRAQFECDLEEKSHALLLRHEERLVGFSTLHVYEAQFEGAPVSVVYSGDTIVAPEAWGSPVLARGWIAAVNALRADYPRGPLYWLLLSSGFRTYRFLPVFWRTFWPRFDTPMPPAVRALRDHLARERFGDHYDDEPGIVRFPHPQRLRSSLAGVPAPRLSDPHIAFFVANNPGHTAGDELVCLTELSDANLTPAGRRMVVRSPADDAGIAR